MALGGLPLDPGIVRSQRLRLVRGLLGLYLLIPFLLLAINSSRSTTTSISLSDAFVAAWHADDPRLAAHIRRHYASPPASDQEPYRLLHPERRHFSQHGQPPLVHRLLGGHRGGVFLEAGALDGELYSNSLYLEREFGWSGLLVEPNPAAFAEILRKRRRSWAIRGCLHSGDRPTEMEMLSNEETGRLADNADGRFRILTSLRHPIHSTRVWCWPVRAVLKAVNITAIDVAVFTTLSLSPKQPRPIFSTWRSIRRAPRFRYWKASPGTRFPFVSCKSNTPFSMCTELPHSRVLFFTTFFLIPGWRMG